MSDKIEEMEDLDGTDLAEFIKTGKGGRDAVKLVKPLIIERKARKELLCSARQQNIFRRSK